MSIEVIATFPKQDAPAAPPSPASVPDAPALPTMKALNRLLAPYQHADTRKALWQLANTLLPFLGLLYLMIRSLEVSYWLTLALALPTAGFMVRLFIFFHDCGHNSFFPSRQANKIVGFLLGVLVWTPSEHWWHAHAVHHATSGNLDKRGTGDVTTLTVEEYRALPLTQRIGYQLFRFPLIMFGLGANLHVRAAEPPAVSAVWAQGNAECDLDQPGHRGGGGGGQPAGRQFLELCAGVPAGHLDGGHGRYLAVLRAAPV